MPNNAFLAGYHVRSSKLKDAGATRQGPRPKTQFIVAYRIPRTMTATQMDGAGDLKQPLMRTCARSPVGRQLAGRIVRCRIRDGEMKGEVLRTSWCAVAPVGATVDECLYVLFVLTATVRNM